jgi:hypothetical protein
MEPTWLDRGILFTDLAFILVFVIEPSKFLYMINE